MIDIAYLVIASSIGGLVGGYVGFNLGAMHGWLVGFKECQALRYASEELSQR